MTDKSEGTQHFVDALRSMGIEPIEIDLKNLADGKCPIHGDGPCPEPKKFNAEELIPDSAEALRIAKVALAGAVATSNDADVNKPHVRLAVAETAMELYDRMLAAEIKAEWDAAPDDLRTDTEREADENAARFPGNGKAE